MYIRQENNNDHASVYSVVQKAFATAEHSDGNEQNLVTALRNGNSFIPELSLVAELNGRIVGHIMFTKAEIGGQTILVLAPLSILPECQKQGIGTALIKEGHRIARELGYSYCSVLGSEAYYPRSGYIPAERLGIETPEGIPVENFMAIQLREEAPPIHGSIRYAQEFGL